MSILPRPFWLFPALACVLLMAKGQRERYTVSFHLEASSEESSKLVFSHEVGRPPQTRHFRRIPEVTHKDFSGFHSFPAADGNGSGVVLQLNDVGTRRLAMATSTSQGSLMRVLVNGEGVDVMFIDRPIQDGRLTIWSGVSEDVVEELEKKLPRLAGRAEVADDPSAAQEQPGADAGAGYGYGDQSQGLDDPGPPFPELPALPQ